MMLQWLRDFHERDDLHLFKTAMPPREVDPIDELSRIVGEAQERDAKDERRFERQAQEHRTKRATSAEISLGRARPPPAAG
jgi:hypothetical protein